MTGRELYGLYRDCHGGETGICPVSYDELAYQQRRVWESLADEVTTQHNAEFLEAQR